MRWATMILANFVYLAVCIWNIIESDSLGVFVIFCGFLVGGIWTVCALMQEMARDRVWNPEPPILPRAKVIKT